MPLFHLLPPQPRRARDARRREDIWFISLLALRRDGCRHERDEAKILAPAAVAASCDAINMAMAMPRVTPFFAASPCRHV